jgi:hypothetical protein
MLLIDRHKTYTQEEIERIENQLLQQILYCSTSAAVEACVTYARFLSLTGITNENYPCFIKVLEVGNHWVIDGLIGERDPFLFLSSIQPNSHILESCFRILTEKHPGELYPKSLSVILGVLQATYNVPEDGYNIYRLSIYDLNTLGKHLNEEIGQEDSLNRVILDILHKIAQLKGRLGSDGLEGEDRDKEDLAIHANEIMSHFYDDTKRLSQVIPQVLLIKKDYRSHEEQPRAEIRFEDSRIYDIEAIAEDPYAESLSDEEFEEDVYEEEIYEEEQLPPTDADREMEPDPA